MPRITIDEDAEGSLNIPRSFSSRCSSRSSHRSNRRPLSSHSVKKVNPNANFLKPTESSLSKRRLNQDSDSSSQKSLSKTQQLHLKLQEVERLVNEQGRGQKSQADHISTLQGLFEKCEERITKNEVYLFEANQKLHRVSALEDRFDQFSKDLTKDTQKLVERVTSLEAEVSLEKAAMADAPTDPVQRQKYLEKRLVLSERNILKLS